MRRLHRGLGSRDVGREPDRDLEGGRGPDGDLGLEGGIGLALEGRLSRGDVGAGCLEHLGRTELARRGSIDGHDLAGSLVEVLARPHRCFALAGNDGTLVDQGEVVDGDAALVGEMGTRISGRIGRHRRGGGKHAGQGQNSA